MSFIDPIVPTPDWGNPFPTVEPDEWEDDDYEYVDEDKLISFLNEYYVVFPKKMPRWDSLSES